MLNKPRKLIAACSMMLALLFVVGTVVPVHAASNGWVGDTTKAGNTMNIALWIAVLVLVGLVICLIMNLRKQIAKNKAYDILDKIFLAYNALPAEVKAMVQSNVDDLKEIFEKVTSKYIEESVQYLAKVNSDTTGKMDELETLEQADEYFEALPYAIKKNVPESIMCDLRMKIASAEMHLPIERSDANDQE